jgi:hypothetical protein
MIDYMPFRDYFRFKLYSVSPKFGIRSNEEDPESLVLHGWKDHGAVAGMGQYPYPSWGACACGTYQEWTDNIVIPFFEAYGGQEVMPTLNQLVQNEGFEFEAFGPSIPDPTNENSNHYEFFNNIMSFVNPGLINDEVEIGNQEEQLPTWGPLVYDFDCDGIWGENDLAIWLAITSYWASLGDDAIGNQYRPANYFSPLVDATGTMAEAFSGGSIFSSPPPQPVGIWNILSGVNTPEDTFSPNNLPISPSNRACFNWNFCLDQDPYGFVYPQQGDVIPIGSIAPYFDYDVTSFNYINSLYNPEYTWYNQNIVNGAAYNYAPIGLPVEARPAENFFPITKFWAP